MSSVIFECGSPVECAARAVGRSASPGNRTESPLQRDSLAPVKLGFLNQRFAFQLIRVIGFLVKKPL